MKNFKQLILSLPLAFAAVLAPSQASAQAFPSKPIRWVIPYPAGGGSDFMARAVAHVLPTELGQPVLVDNKPGGNGVVAVSDILRSPKHLTGPDLGIATLTYRAWHEAKFGAAHWEKLHKIDREEWANYLIWVREAAALPVENGVEVQ